MALASAGSSATRTAKPAALTNLGITLEQPGRADRTKSEWRYLRGRSGGLPQTIVILSRMVVRVLRSGGARLLDSADKMYFDHRIRPGPEGHGSRGGLVLRVVPDRPEVGPAPWRSLRPDERHLRAQRSWLAHVPFLRMVLLVLLYAQGPAAINRLTLDHVPSASSTCGSGSAASPSCCPGHSTPSSSSSPPPAADTPRWATREAPAGCSPADSPASRSAPTAWPSDYASSGSAPARAGVCCSRLRRRSRLPEEARCQATATQQWAPRSYLGDLCAQRRIPHP